MQFKFIKESVITYNEITLFKTQTSGTQVVEQFIWMDDSKRNTPIAPLIKPSIF